MNKNPRADALERLTRFVGTWRVEASFSPSPDDVANSDLGDASATFEWAFGGQYLMQHSNAPDPAPDSLAIVSIDADRGSYVQHYFDSRGVVRVYAMTFHDGVWTLLRESPDFSPLEFSQRFTGTFSDDGDSIVGRWEISRDGSPWERDFDLSYFRVRQPDT
jgi:hypothetical protein